MEKTKSSLHAHANGGLTTVLSIDGGGIRGIIPRVMLAFLESKLRAPISHNIYWKELSMLVYVSVAFLIVHIVKGKHYCNGHTSQQKQDNSNECTKNHEMKL
ncbi:hypothetical protein GBA52_022409 [Prunus armeniaca]|nr:hypothetical protein GBA52_022409 [Prunus armeniaca]